MKYLAISLKANNPYKDQNYRNKYKEKLIKFLKHCDFENEIK